VTDICINVELDIPMLDVRFRARTIRITSSRRRIVTPCVTYTWYYIVACQSNSSPVCEIPCWILILTVTREKFNFRFPQLPYSDTSPHTGFSLNKLSIRSRGLIASLRQVTHSCAGSEGNWPIHGCPWCVICLF
jgi:hypothetical protein